MSIHPNVEKLLVGLAKTPYVSPAETHALLKEYVEAWLRDDRWVPELLSGGKIGGNIFSQFMPREVSSLPSGELIAKWLSNVARLNNLDAVCIGMAMSERLVGEPRPPLPNMYFLGTCSKDLGQPLISFWNIRIDESGTVFEWSPNTDDNSARIAEHWLNVF